MVRRDGKPYRKASQKGPRGGKTRRENLRDKLLEKRRRLRENNNVELTFSSKAAELAAERYPNKEEHVAVYGIYRDDEANDWVLTGFSVTDKEERMNNSRGGGYTKTEVQARYALTPNYDSPPDPENGLEIDRFDSKRDAMREVRADTTTKLEAGRYVVKIEDDPSTLYGTVVDKNAFNNFRNRSVRFRPN